MSMSPNRHKIALAKTYIPTFSRGKFAFLLAFLGVIGHPTVHAQTLLTQDFGSTPVGSSSTAVSLSLLYTGLSNAPLFSLANGSEFTLGSTNCSGASNLTCNVQVTFSPKAPGLRQDALIVRATGSLAPLSVVTLHGIGNGPQAEFLPGQITVTVGGGTADYTGDGDIAVRAALRTPQAIALDTKGDLFIADTLNHAVRKVDAATGVISTIAGTGVPGFSGDGGAAVSAKLNDPVALTVDPVGDVFIADKGNNRVRRVDALTGGISTYAGGGVLGSGGTIGNGGVAAAAVLSAPSDVALDVSGNLYIADTGHNAVRMVVPVTGIITTVAGGGSAAGNDGLGDGGLAVNAKLYNPQGVAVAADGTLFIADSADNLIRMVSSTSQIITAVAGTGVSGFSGDNGLAINAKLNRPASVKLDAAGDLYVADTGNNVVRTVSNATGIIGALAGSHQGGSTGNNGNPLQASLNTPTSVALDSSGNIYVADSGHNSIKLVSRTAQPLTFPKVAVGTPSTPDVMGVINVGNQPLAISAMSIIGADYQQQASGSTDCAASVSLTPGAQCQLAVAFTPSSTAAAAGNLNLQTNSLNDTPSAVSVMLDGSGSTSGNGGAAQACTFSVPATLNLGPGAGTQSVQVTTQPGCAYLASTDSSFITVSGGSSGTGSGTVNLTLAPNSGLTPRTGTVTAGGQVLTVTQSGSNVTLTTALHYVPITPCRVVDTRGDDGALGGPIVAGGTSRDFPIPAGVCAIPATAQAYALNVTVVPSAVLGYLTVWPAGQPQPQTSLLNSDGRIKANATIVAAGTLGAVSVYASDSTHVVLDISGYFIDSTVDPTALAFYPLTPCRVADTRLTASPLGGPSLSAGETRDFPMQSSTCNLPSNAQAYSLNVTAVPQEPLFYLTTWETGQPMPLASTLNSDSGAIVANAAVIPAGTNGDVSVYSTAATDVVLDINGYFAAPGSGGLSLYGVTPCRVLDTRQQNGSPFTGTLPVDVTAGTCAIPSADAYAMNATVIPPAELGFLALYQTGVTRPLVSTLNDLDGSATSNMAVVPATSGSIDAFANGTTHLFLDVTGYFAP